MIISISLISIVICTILFVTFRLHYVNLISTYCLTSKNVKYFNVIRTISNFFLYMLILSILTFIIILITYLGYS